MKKRYHRLSALLLAAVMICTPVTEAYAAVSYEVTEGTEGILLFPGDSITGITSSVMVDDEEGILSENGTWTNEKKKKVYRVSQTEEGTYVMTSAGYKLEVIGGISEYADPEITTENHYEYSEEEKLSGEELNDIACYEEGDQVKLIAEDPESGMQFAGWQVDSEEFSLEDSVSPEVTFEMPKDSLTITALYEEAAPVTYQATVNYGSGSGAYEAGAAVSVTADDRTAENLTFAGWYVESQNISLADTMAATVEFVMPESDVMLTATYEETPLPVETEGATEAPAVVETEGATEAPAVVETEKTTEAPVAVETEKTTEAPVVVETENTTEAPVVVETEKTTEAPVVVETEKTTEAPVAVETEKTTEAPVAVETEKTTEAPVVAETEKTTEAPVAVETEKTTEAPVVVETEGTTEAPAPAETEAVQKYEVTVENGSGSGEYVPGEIVTIEADTVSGKAFSQWDSSEQMTVLENPTESVTTFVMPETSVTLTAEYAAATHTVTLENATDGNGAMEGVYEENATVTVIAAEAPLGMAFTGFEGTVTIADQMTALTFADAKAATTTFVMPQGDVTVRAVYAELPKTYLVNVSNGLINNTATQIAVEEGTQITVTANPSPYGQQFSKWTVNGGAYDLGENTFQPSITVTVTEAMNFLAVYEGVQYTVSVESGSSDYEECVVGTVVTLTADEAPKGMKFDYWNVDGQNVTLADASSEVTTFVMPDNNVSVSAVYKRVKYQVSVQNGSADQEYYYYGDTVTVTSKYPASGRVFDQWTAESGKADFADASRWKTTFKMPARNVTVAANYKDGPSTADNLVLDLVAGGEYYIGDTIKFSASGAGMANTNPNPGDYRYRPSGYQIGNVTGTWKAEPYTTSMAINAAGEYTLKVIYNKDIYDGNSWVTDGTSDTKSVTFRVVTKAAGVATGDETPIGVVIVIAAVSCVLFLVLLTVVLLRRRKR